MVATVTRWCLHDSEQRAATTELRELVNDDVGEDCGMLPGRIEFGVEHCHTCADRARR